MDAKTEIQPLARHSGVHLERVDRLAYSPDSRLLASSDVSGRVVLREVDGGRIRARLPDQPGSLSTLAFWPDGRKLLTVSRGEGRIWDLGKPDRPEAELALGSLDALTLLPDGEHAVLADTSRVLQVLHLPDGERVRSLGRALPDDEARQNLLSPTDVALSPDGAQLVAARWDQSAALWNWRTGEKVRELGGFLRAAWSPDGKRIAVAAGMVSKRRTELRIVLLDAASGDKLLEIEDEAAFGFAPRGRHLVAVDGSGVRFYELGAGKRVARIDTRDHKPWTFAFSPDGRRLATGGSDAAVVEWDLGGLEK
ncbi:MAG: PD40 domain-containing protein [Deltaproteobacteria bacterium]|nr:PD40 domain-containing protein [Deltaproteobacteria bacterium]